MTDNLPPAPDLTGWDSLKITRDLCLCSHPPSLHHAHQGICWGLSCTCPEFHPDDGRPIPESSVLPNVHDDPYNGIYLGTGRWTA